MVSFATSFVVPQDAEPTRDFSAEFQRLCTTVNPVNHGEFEGTALALVEEAAIDESESTNRARPLAIQRCRRGGKTFMLHAVASMLESYKGNRLPTETKIIFISLNSVTPYTFAQETAYDAILSRIAWELTNRNVKSFINFRDSHSDFGAVDNWLTDKKVILIVDELNIIPPTTPRYEDMSALVANIVQRDGCAVLYSTHQRSTADLLRGRVPGASNLTLSKRRHIWKQIPRIVNEDCLRGLYKQPTEEPSFWSAVLRGRLPALVLQDRGTIAEYTDDMFMEQDSTEERTNCLKATISGDIDSLTNARNLFRAYSYMSERFTQSNDTPRYAWPAFMIAQQSVLGKDYRHLTATLQHPSIDEAKAFEALTQLAILIRLMTGLEHDLVPLNSDAIERADIMPFEATELFYAGQESTTIHSIVTSISRQFSRRTNVMQVVAVPLFASFPVYDFFVLHRISHGWRVAAGYQCKQGTKYPNEDADEKVALSVWLEGKCRKYRVGDDGALVDMKEERGWLLLGENNQMGLLGVSISEALPQDPSPQFTAVCAAEQQRKELQGPPSKKHRSDRSVDSVKA